MTRFAVVVFPGTNCEGDVQHAIRAVTGRDAALVWHQEGSLDGFDAAVIPGGFAHGDYLRAGSLARFSPVMAPLVRMAASGRPVAGICNGFQILQEAGLLPGAMLKNRSLAYVCRDVRIRVEDSDSPLTCGVPPGTVLRMPVGHAEGNFRAAEEVRAIFRYCDEAGEIADEANPNGSRDGIAGVRNERGNVAAMMPHPDRAYEADLGGTDGRLLFESMVRYAES